MQTLAQTLAGTICSIDRAHGMSRPRFLLDEHVWGGLVDVGRRVGVDVLLAQTQLPEGVADEDVLRFAAQQERIVLTGNAQDFGPIARQWFLLGRNIGGVIVPGQTDKSLLGRALETWRAIIQLIIQKHFRFWREFIESLHFKNE
jgi:hypothetical protein